MDCQSCGACCIHGGEVTVELDDLDRPEEVPRDLTRSVRGKMGFASDDYLFQRIMARSRSGSCVALRGEVGKSCGCSIYDRRPNVCREYEPGGRDCLYCRRIAGII